jgi:cytochrome b561
MNSIKLARYDSFAMTLHWVIAALLIVMLIFGEAMMDAQEGAAWLPSLHVSIGFTILALSLIRLAWRFVNAPPPLLRMMAPWEKLACHVSHVLAAMKHQFVNQDGVLKRMLPGGGGTACGDHLSAHLVVIPGACACARKHWPASHPP